MSINLVECNQIALMEKDALIDKIRGGSLEKDPFNLTDKESMIIKGLISGKNLRQMAQEMNISLDQAVRFAKGYEAKLQVVPLFDLFHLLIIWVINGKGLEECRAIAINEKDKLFDMICNGSLQSLLDLTDKELYVLKGFVAQRSLPNLAQDKEGKFTSYEEAQMNTRSVWKKVGDVHNLFDFFHLLIIVATRGKFDQN